MFTVGQIQLVNIFRMNFQKDVDDLFQGKKEGVVFQKLSSGDIDKVFCATECKKVKISKKNVRYSNYLGYMLDFIMIFKAERQLIINFSFNASNY